MDRTQREYDRLGALRKIGGEQESGCELRNYEYETMSGTSISQFCSPSLANPDDGHTVPTTKCL